MPDSVSCPAPAASKRKPARPPIRMRESDADRLSELAVRIEASQPRLAAMLTTEIDRARVVADGKLPKSVVAMGSTVRFADDTTGTERTVQLVYPHQADIEAGRLSILTPVGAGLIGLAEGQSIVWRDRGEHERVLRVVKVTSSDD